MPVEPSPEQIAELQAIAKDIEGVNSVSSLAGYEVLTEGRGSNAGTCLINLKPWSERKLSSRQIIEQLEEKGRAIGNVICASAHARGGEA